MLPDDLVFLPVDELEVGVPANGRGNGLAAHVWRCAHCGYVARHPEQADLRRLAVRHARTHTRQEGPCSDPSA